MAAMTEEEEKMMNSYETPRGPESGGQPVVFEECPVCGYRTGITSICVFMFNRMVHCAGCTRMMDEHNKRAGEYAESADEVKARWTAATEQMNEDIIKKQREIAALRQSKTNAISSFEGEMGRLYDKFTKMFMEEEMTGKCQKWELHGGDRKVQRMFSVYNIYRIYIYILFVPFT